jgi:hypothetical protein
MKDTPPFLSDEEADNTYNAACAWMFGTTKLLAIPSPPRREITDICHPNHPRHHESIGIRNRISHALQHQEFMRDFPRQYVPPRAQSLESHKKLSALLLERDRIESELETLHSAINPDGSSIDPHCGIDKEYILMRDAAYGVNRSMYEAYVKFLEPLKDTRSMRIRTTTRKDGGTLESRRHLLAPYNTSADKDSFVNA